MPSNPLFSRRAFGLVCAVLLAIQGGNLRAAETAPSVRLTIDYGDGVQKSFAALAWKDKLTVFDALQLAAEHPRGIRVSHTGSGETTFITAIDDLANEGQGASNWRYTVNDKPARYSAGVAELKPGDSVVWRFVK
jgi:Domain of unknown function (DUF4430)